MADEKKTPAPYVHQPYPAKRYGPKPNHQTGQLGTGATCYVQDEAADKALGPGWHDHPAKVGSPKDKE